MSRKIAKHATLILRNNTWERVFLGVNCQPQGQKSFHHCTRPAVSPRTSESCSKFYRGLSNSIVQKHWPVAVSSRNMSKDSTSATANFHEKGGTSSAGTIYASPPSQQASSASNPVHDTPKATPNNPGPELGTKSRPINPAASKEVKLFYFDTLRLASKFQDQGFTQNQAFCIVEAFVEVLNTSIEHQTKNMVTKPDQEIMVQQLLAKIDSVKKDMVILEKSEFTMLRNETDKQTIEIKQMKSLIGDEITKLQGHVKLDVNLERGRAAEAHAANQRELQLLSNKIDTQVANLRTTYEQYRNDVMKFASGTVLSCAAIMLGCLRLMT